MNTFSTKQTDDIFENCLLILILFNTVSESRIEGISEVATHKNSTFSGGKTPTLNATDGDAATYVENNPKSDTWFKVNLVDHFYILKISFLAFIENPNKNELTHFWELKGKEFVWDECGSRKTRTEAVWKMIEKTCYKLLKKKYSMVKYYFTLVVPVKLKNFKVFVVKYKECTTEAALTCTTQAALTCTTKKVNKGSDDGRNSSKSHSAENNKKKKPVSEFSLWWVGPVIFSIGTVGTAVLMVLVRKSKRMKIEVEERRKKERKEEDRKEEETKEKETKYEETKEEGDMTEENTNMEIKTRSPTKTVSFFTQ